MISQKLQDAINNQIQAEMYSAYLYLSMSSYMAGKNFKGFAHWLHIQYVEETGHALKFQKYLIDRDGDVKLKAIEAPPSNFGDASKLFGDVLKHEQKVSGMINKLYELALSEKDYATQSFLIWFINEQVEEEATATEILAKIEMVNDRPGSLLYLDKEMGKRVAG